MSKFSIINQSVSAQTAAKNTQKINLKNNFTHAMITGETGCGKTTSAILPILEDRIEAGHGIIFFDYKGAEHMKVKYLAQKHGRLKDITMMNVPWGVTTNIVQETDDKILGEFLFKEFGGEGKDPFWASMATNIALKSLNLLKKIYNLRTNLLFVLLDISGGLMRDVEPSLRGLFNKTKTIDDLVEFYRQLKLYEKKINDNQHFASCMIKNLSDFGKYLPMKEYEEYLVCDIDVLLEARDAVRGFLEHFKQYAVEINKNEQKARFYGNYEFMLTAIYDIVDSDLINTQQESVSALADKGKIVIINANGLRNSVLSLITNSAILNLSNRRGDKNPVSVFIDEAQRVVTASFDLGTDILREAKTEIILAFQNEDIFKNALNSETKYKEIVGNLTSKFFFRNSQSQYAGGALMDLSALEDFEYFKDGKIYKAEPVFLSESDLLKAELEYQKINKIREKFANKALGENEILVYDERLFKQENRFICKQIDNSSEYSSAPFLNQRQKDAINNIMKFIKEQPSIPDTRDLVRGAGVEL